MSDDEGEGPSGGTRNNTSDARVEVNDGGGDGTGKSSDIVRGGLGNEDEILSTNEFSNNVADPLAPVSSIVAENTQGRNVEPEQQWTYSHFLPPPGTFYG
jgi:hypothetical protein